jgi:hypothetical protein
MNCFEDGVVVFAFKGNFESTVWGSGGVSEIEILFFFVGSKLVHRNFLEQVFYFD